MTSAKVNLDSLDYQRFSDFESSFKYKRPGVECPNGAVCYAPPNKAISGVVGSLPDIDGSSSGSGDSVASHDMMSTTQSKVNRTASDAPPLEQTMMSMNRTQAIPVSNSRSLTTHTRNNR